MPRSTRSPATTFSCSTSPLPRGASAYLANVQVYHELSTHDYEVIVSLIQLRRTGVRPRLVATAGLLKYLQQVRQVRGWRGEGKPSG